MHNLNQKESSDIYNEEPVFYCAECLSLRIRNINDSQYCYCDSCGCTNIEEANIFVWEKMYVAKYGKKFIND